MILTNNVSKQADRPIILSCTKASLLLKDKRCLEKPENIQKKKKAIDIPSVAMNFNICSQNHNNPLLFTQPAIKCHQGKSLNSIIFHLMF